jgi:hypothetical protein
MAPLHDAQLAEDSPIDDPDVPKTRKAFVPLGL